MRLSDVIERIEAVAPFGTAESWDNSGLLLGDPGDEVRRVGVCLDATKASIEEASSRGCDLLVTHHPMIFPSLRRIDRDSIAARAIRSAIGCGISVLCAHTNWDRSDVGVNAVLAGRLGLHGASPLRGGENGFGRIGFLDPLPFGDFLGILRERWTLSWVAGYGDAGRTIRSAALCGGSGRDFLRDAVESGADVFCTADLTYHDVMEARNYGVCVALADHGEMERVSMKRLAEIIGGNDLPVDVLVSEELGERLHV